MDNQVTQKSIDLIKVVIITIIRGRKKEEAERTNKMSLSFYISAPYLGGNTNII